MTTQQLPGCQETAPDLVVAARRLAPLGIPCRSGPSGPSGAGLADRRSSGASDPPTLRSRGRRVLGDRGWQGRARRSSRARRRCRSRPGCRGARSGSSIVSASPTATSVSAGAATRIWSTGRSSSPSRHRRRSSVAAGTPGLGRRGGCRRGVLRPAPRDGGLRARFRGAAGAGHPARAICGVRPGRGHS